MLYGEYNVFIFFSFGIPLILTACIGMVLGYLGRREIGDLREREAFALAGFLWLIMAFFGSLPYILSGTLPNFIDAYFESMSGFVTCGNTVINDVEVLPHSILLWRSLTQWIGGLGIIVLAVVILSRILGGSTGLYRAEVPGHVIIRLRPKVRDTALVLWGIYLLFTLTEILLLWGAGMSLFDAVNHSLTTLATGGFSTKNASIGYFNSPIIETIIIIFMLIGSTSFILHHEVLRGKIKKLFRDSEFRFYLLLIAFFTIVITLDLSLRSVYSLGQSFRYALFQTVSMNGTVGFTSVDFGPASAHQWPMSSLFLLVIMMLIGASSGSTGGALKVIRSLILLKAAKREFHRILHPKAVIPLRIGDQIIPDVTVRNVAIFTFIYLVIFASATVSLLFMGLDLPSASSASASALGNVGSGIGASAGTYSFIHPLGKIFLILCMWLGRLEIFAAAIIFFPSTYKK